MFAYVFVLHHPGSVFCYFPIGIYIYMLGISGISKTDSQDKKTVLKWISLLRRKISKVVPFSF